MDDLRVAADFGWILLVFAALSVIGEIRKKQRAARERAAQGAGDDGSAERARDAALPSGRRTVSGAGDTRAEGHALEEWLRGLEEALGAKVETPDASSRPSPSRRPATKPTRAPPVLPSEGVRTGRPARTGRMGRAADRPLEGAEEVEERTSLETIPEVVSLEGEVSRPARELVDYDQVASAVVQRRIAAAAARDREHRASDHEAFHARLRSTEIADHTATRRFTPAELRRAVIWQEVLGTPKGME